MVWSAADMAARKKSEKSEKSEAGEPERKPPTRFELWWEEAWEGWIKAVAPVVALGAGYLLYKFDVVGERFAGVALVLIIVGGSVLSLAWPAWTVVQAKKPAVRWTFFAMLAMAIFAGAWPSLRVASPPPAVAEGQLTSSALTTTIKTGTTGPYDLTVSGDFKTQGMSDVEVNYDLHATSDGTTREIEGTLKRQVMQGRRGARSLSERNEHTHRLELKGGAITFSTDGIDQELAGPLTLTLRKAGPNPMLFWILGGLAILIGLAFDARTTDAKGRLKTYMAAGNAIALSFAIVFPQDATPHSVVKPAVSALLLALVIGGLGGALLSVIARVLFGPKIKRRRA